MGCALGAQSSEPFGFSSASTSLGNTCLWPQCPAWVGVLSLVHSLPATTACLVLTGKGWWEEGKTGRSHTDKLRLWLGNTQLQVTRQQCHSDLW